MVGIISARGGSKGLPRKNLELLVGKPLIGYAIETARNCAALDRIVVSTEDEEIAALARQYGAEVPFIRPAELATDNSPHWAVWRHAVITIEAQEGKRMAALVELQTTSPLRAVEDVEGCVQQLLSGKADAVVSVTESRRSPCYNMVRFRGKNISLLNAPCRPFVRRQDLPKVYEMNGAVYALRRDFVLEKADLFGGQVEGNVMPPDRSLDIDSSWDLYLAELVLRDRHERKSV